MLKPMFRAPRKQIQRKEQANRLLWTAPEREPHGPHTPKMFLDHKLSGLTFHDPETASGFQGVKFASNAKLLRDRTRWRSQSWVQEGSPHTEQGLGLLFYEGRACNEVEDGGMLLVFGPPDLQGGIPKKATDIKRTPFKPT